MRTFDDAGRMTAVTDWLGNQTTFAHDPNSNLVETVFPAATGNVDTHTYDRADRATAISWAKGTNTLGSVGYERNPEGFVSSATPTGLPDDPTMYGYDARDQLTSTTATTMAYDLAGNLVERGDGTFQVFDPAQQLCWSSPTTAGDCATPPADATGFDYDERGNRTAARPPGGVPRGFGYDQEDRLVSARVPATEGAGGQYHPVTATRVLATKAPKVNCPAGCGRLAAGVSLDVQVGGLAGVPASGVSTVVLTVAAVDPAGPGWLNLYPTGDPEPAAASVMFDGGATVSNTVVAEVGTNGRVRVRTTTATDVAVEVVGWHADGSGADPGLLFEPVDATRVMDTVPPVGSCTPSPCARLGPWATTTVQVAGHGGVPAGGVAAVTVVLHAVNPTGDGLVIAWPAGAAPPGAATMAYSGVLTSATAVVPVDEDGRISVLASTATDLAIEVVGYHTSPETGDGLTAHPTVPTIIGDTRTATGACEPSPCARLAAATPVGVEVAGHGGVPAGADAAAVVIHAVDPAAPGYLTAWAAGAAQPAAASLTWGDAELTSGTAIVALGADGQISLSSSTPVDVVIQTVGWYQAATATWTYTYDPDGLRSATIAPDGSATTFSWDRAAPVPLLLAETTTEATTYLIYGPEGLPVEEIRPDGSVYWYHHDQLGSTRMLTDQNGDVAATATYGAYGAPTAATAATGTVTPTLGFAGEYHDAETGFVYLRARHYDPATGQFLTRDPLEALTGEPYGYAGNNPLNNTDPTGLCWGPTCIVEDAIDAGGDLIGRSAEVVREAAQDTGEFLVRNRGTIATGIGIAICVGASLGVCAGATAAAFAVRSQKALGDHDRGWEGARGSILTDGAITAATFGLVSVPASRAFGGAVGAHLARADRGLFWGAPLSQSVFSRGLVASPDLVALAGSARLASGC